MLYKNPRFEISNRGFFVCILYFILCWTKDSRLRALYRKLQTENFQFQTKPSAPTPGGNVPDHL